MPHLLHVDASFAGDDNSVSRRYSARAVEAWLAANPGGTVTRRDLAADPLPHFDADANGARFTPPAEHTPAQAAAWQLARTLVDEVRAADTIILGVPLYNWSAPSTVKAWIDHMIAPGLSRDPETSEGLLGGREIIIVSVRGGAYGPGTPKEGWNHLDPWIEKALSSIGLEPRLVAIEMTLADVVPALAEFKDLAAANREAADVAIVELVGAAA